MQDDSPRFKVTPRKLDLMWVKTCEICDRKKAYKVVGDPSSELTQQVLGDM